MIAWHYSVSAQGVHDAHAEGRRFYSTRGELLMDVAAVKAEFRARGEVVSMTASEPKDAKQRDGEVVSWP